MDNQKLDELSFWVFEYVDIGEAVGILEMFTTTLRCSKV